MASLPWFRLYHEFAADPCIQSLAFEDQRHYLIVLCLKCAGTIDKTLDPKVRERIILSGLGLDPVKANEVKRRLAEVGLISDDWQPRGWDKRQFKSDFDSTANDRQRRHRANLNNVTDVSRVTNGVSHGLVTRPEQNRTDTDKEIKALSGKPDVFPLKINRTAEAREILAFLNTKVGKAFRPVDANIKPIIARLGEGVTMQDIKSVIARKNREWGTDEKMMSYLRPATLFNATKFHQYVGECMEAKDGN